MTTQSDGSIYLDYRTPPQQAQSGGAIVLDYATAFAPRVVRASVAASWRQPDTLRSPCISPIAVAAQADVVRVASWSIARAQGSRRRATWAVAGTADAVRVAPWGRFERVSPPRVALPWGVAAIADRVAGVPWGAYGDRPRAGVVPSWAAPHQADIAAIAPWDIRIAHRETLAAVVPQGVPTGREWILPWVRYSSPLNPGWGVVTPPNETPIDEHGTVLVPIRGAYIVLNSATLTVAATGQPIQHTGLSLQLDIDSWSWGWSASVPASYLTTLRPSGPDGFVEVIATINGEPFRLLVESLQRERRFGRADLRIGGRSRTAWLSSPHSPTITRYNSESRTAQQLLQDALTDNGISIGWTVDWQITDWLVPAGAWSHQGSYIDAAVRIAEAAGAVIQPHPTDQTLRVLHRYPATPWEWPAATPDIELPEDVVTVEGIEWADKPRYDAVYLAGSILAHVKRAGTSGGTVAPMVTDPLLTHADATRQRARAILSDTGREAEIRLGLPVLDETGIIQPGTLIQYTEHGASHIGITRAVDVQCGWPAITQTITVETHELEPV